MPGVCFIEPCRSSPGDRPPSGSNETPLIFDLSPAWEMTGRTAVEAVNHLKVRSRLIDGEVVCCDERGVAAFQLLRHRRNEPKAFTPLTSWS